MLLLIEPFCELADVTEALSSSLAEGRDEESQSLLDDLDGNNRVASVLVVWADLISLAWPSGESAFQHVREQDPHTAWLPHATAMVNASGAGDMAGLRNACARLFAELDDAEMTALFYGLAVGVRGVLDSAGGIEWLRESVGLHRACANPAMFSVPSRERILSPAGWIIAAVAAGQYETARERTATLVGSSPDVWEWVSALWLQIGSVLMTGGGRIVEVEALSGLPTTMMEPGTPHPQMHTARLIQTGVDALRRRDEPALNGVLRDVLALGEDDKAVLIWQLSRTIGARLGQRLSEPA
ncbi:hypothetical protein [Streptomyces hokutonensis]|uniref:hypothetical protein n=1 Tax=Streptomyces hokutonensis TaxID=1306990 RepID=UPI000372B4D8|nr:hypothetical protein [Streptomyces hokutonensis]